MQWQECCGHLSDRDDQWHANLAKKMMKKNNQMKFFKVSIDVFCHIGWDEALKEQDPRDNLRTFKMIFAQGRVPE